MPNHISNKTHLPSNWFLTRLSEVTDTTRQRRHPQDHPDLHYIGLENVEAETMRLLGTQRSSELNSMADYFEEGDVLYARLRPYLNKVYQPDFKGLCSSEFIIFRKLENLNNKYLQYLLNSRDFVSHAMNKITGDRPRVTFEDISDYPFPLPPLDEQQRIVDEIELQFSRLDAWLEVMQKLRKKLTRLRASILKAAVEGRLVAQDPNDEPAEVLLQRILDERRRKWEEDYLADLKAQDKPVPKDDRWKEKYKEPEAPYIDGLSELPEGWIWASVEQLGAIGEQPVLTGPFGSNLGRSNFTESGVPVLTIGCLTEQGINLEQAQNITVKKAAELERYQVRIGDLLFSRMASVGRIGLVNKQISGSIINYHIMRLRLASEIIVSEYFVHYVRGSQTVTNYLLTVNHGATRPGINTKQLSGLPVAVPPIDGQRAIVEDINYRFAAIIRLEEIIEVSVKRAKRMYQSILQKAFEGRLVEQYLDEEPASELLDRVRREREKRAKEERQKPKPKRERKVKTTKVVKKPLYETLEEAGKPLSVRDLFQQAGFSQETIDDFYEELREAVDILETIRIRQNGTDEVSLEAIN